MHNPTDRIAHTTAFVTPVVEHWLEWEIAQWVHPMKDRSNDPSHHERTLLPRSYISLLCIIGELAPLGYAVLENQAVVVSCVWSISTTGNIELITVWQIPLLVLFLVWLVPAANLLAHWAGALKKKKIIIINKFNCFFVFLIIIQK